MNQQDERDLVSQCIAGDRKSQKLLYDKYSRTMFGVCLRYSNGYDDAKDIMQDGFVKVFTKMQQFTFNGSFEGWMKRVFINTALEHYRVNKQHMLQSDTDAALDIPHHDFTLDKISIKEILEVMNKMAPGYRTVLNLFLIEGYSHAEIGEMLDISEGTSKSQLSRARTLLQQELLKQQNKSSR